MKEIKKENLKRVNDDKNAILRHALSKNSLYEIVASQDAEPEMDFNFDINIKTLPAANQKASGRCWIFAATNVWREIIASKCNMSIISARWSPNATASCWS